MNPGKLTACAVAVVAVVLPAPGPAQPPDETDEALEKLREAMQGLKVRTEMMAAQSAADENETDPESGLERNIVYDSSADLPTTTRRAVDRCVNPPQERRASYSVGLIASDPPRLGSPLGPSNDPTPRVVFEEDEYVDGIVAEHAPPPRQEGRPAVRLVFNVEDEEWAYSLGGGWGDAALAEEYLDERFEEVGVAFTEASVAEAVCEAVSVFENLLEQTEDRSVEAFLTERDLRDRVGEAESKLAKAARPFQRRTSGERGALYAEAYRPAASKAGRALGRAREALEARRLDRARSLVEHAEDQVDRAAVAAETLRTHRETFRRLQSQLESSRSELWLRRTWWLPGGETINGKLHQCSRNLDEYSDAVDSERRKRRLEDLRTRTETCLEKLRATRRETAASFNLWVLYLPLGLLLIGGGFGFNVLRKKRKKRRMAKIDWQSVRSEWKRVLSTARGRLGEWRKHYPELLDASGADRLDDEAIERIDLLSALTEHAAGVLAEADGIAAEESPFGHARFERAHELLSTDSLMLRPGNTLGDTIVRDQLRETHEIPHGRLPERLESLLEDVHRDLEAAAGADQHW